MLTAALKEKGFAKTLKELRRYHKIKRNTSQLFTVSGGIVEVGQYGQVDAALETEEGPRVVICEGQRRHHAYEEDDAQLLPENASRGSLVGDLDNDPEQLLAELEGYGTSSGPHLICETELAAFDAGQKQRVLPLLWDYIIAHRNSNDPDKLVAVGSAIRKYIAIMPLDRLGDISVLLEPGNQEPLPLDLELEVAKMIFRSFETHPPTQPDPHPELATRLWQMSEAYTNPHILLRGKHSAVASLMIEAVVAMCSQHAFDAWIAAINSPYQWFGELVTDDLNALQRKWADNSPNAVQWLRDLRRKVFESTAEGKVVCAEQP